jgi:hypothetical protein
MCLKYVFSLMGVIITCPTWSLKNGAFSCVGQVNVEQTLNSRSIILYAVCVILGTGF